MKHKTLFYLVALPILVSCSDSIGNATDDSQSLNLTQTDFHATIIDGLHETWNIDDAIILFHNGLTANVNVQGNDKTSSLSDIFDGAFTDNNPLLGAYPADAALSADKESVTVQIPANQTSGSDGFDEKAAVSVARTISNELPFRTVCGGIKLNFQMTGITKVELESVDGCALAGKVRIKWDEHGAPTADMISDASPIITLNADNEAGFTTGKDYYISTLPCDVYGGYRLSIYKNGQVAHYFGVHQTVERAAYITPADLEESALEFADPNAPLVEEERPELDATTNALLRQYQKDPTEENKQALLNQMGLRYDKVVARKKAKLRELEREAKTQSLIDEMQEIVDEMVENRETRLEQQFLRLIDPRTDEDPNDVWMVLRGASAPNAYICYTSVTNAEYAKFKEDFTYSAGTDNYPVVNVSVTEAISYCDWLTSHDNTHVYRLPTDEEWGLAAGHMPKDVAMNSGGVEQGLTAVDAYKQTTGACGGIDFWGNCWEWTSTTDAAGLYIIKGGSWDSDRDDCRSEKSDVVRTGSQGYANVGFRVVRIDAD